jgi:glycosyltransferase involved in cell wall biosynthesis
MGKNQYTGGDVVFIIPTKDRPKKIINVLTSLAHQTESCGRVIVVASGINIRNIVLRFVDRLNIEYYHCDIPGQIRQRNQGILKLNCKTKLVGFIDDDIIFKSDALEKLINFWNTKSTNTAGIGFNIIDEKQQNNSILKMVYRNVIVPGHVYHSGFNSSIAGINNSISTKWLNGGTTIWRQDIIAKYKHQIINSTWAICEDLIFSYPIGKSYPLYVCAEACVLHDHVINPSAAYLYHKLRGKTWALWHLYFVKINKDLSLISYIFMILMITILGLFIGIFSYKRRYYLKYYFGIINGAIVGIKTIVQRKDLKILLEDINIKP